MPIKTEHRITALESNYQSLNEKVDEIKDNHLAHLKADIEKIDNRTWWILGTVILGFLASIAVNLWK